jgi:pullulanase/glycogen debranching enzyme
MDCQNNEISWLDWKLAKEHAGLPFCQGAVAAQDLWRRSVAIYLDPSNDICG